MADAFAKVKSKVRRSLDGKPRERPDSPGNKLSDSSSNKPLPHTPNQHNQTTSPTIRQVNAFGTEDGMNGETFTRRAHNDVSSKRASNQLLPELDMERLRIDDPTETSYDAHSPSIYGKGNRAPPVPSHSAHPRSVDLIDAWHVSKSKQHDPIASAIPNRRSSKNFELPRNEASAGAHNLNHPPSPQAAVRRKKLSSGAQLPPGFELGDSVDTTVEVRQAPAVTHEVVHKHTEEIIHEVITRDIHVDHHFHYVQPIKETIIKPAMHYTINEKGEKVKIEAPADWVTPHGMTPTVEESKEAQAAKLGGIVEGIQARRPMPSSDNIETVGRAT